MKALSTIHRILLLTLAIGLPGGVAVLHRRYGEAALILTTSFLMFSVPAWLRLWQTPEGVMLSLAGVGLIILWQLYCAVKSRGTYARQSFALIKVCGYAGIILVICLGCLSQSRVIWGYQLFFIPSESMTPTLLPGDYVLVDTKFYRDHPPKIGDILVFNRHYIAGDRVNIKRVTHIPGHLFHGKPLADNELAVMGDNRDNSNDSRVMGAIQQRDLKGKAVWIAFSYDPAGYFRHHRMGLVLNTLL